jgi:hypothetical protein
MPQDGVVKKIDCAALLPVYTSRAGSYRVHVKSSDVPITKLSPLASFK